MFFLRAVLDRVKKVLPDGLNGLFYFAGGSKSHDFIHIFELFVFVAFLSTANLRCPPFSFSLGQFLDM